MDECDGADVAEMTDLVDLSAWPEGARAIVRREEPHPDAQLTVTDVDGHRFQVIITDQPERDVTYLEALQRGRGRAEKLICDLKNTGLTNLPSADFKINTAWLTTTLIAHDLLAWCRLLALDHDLAWAEPKRLRYRVLHTAAQLAHTARQTRLRLPTSWPWGQRARHRVQTRRVPPATHLTPRRRHRHRNARPRWDNPPAHDPWPDTPQHARSEATSDAPPTTTRNPASPTHY